MFHLNFHYVRFTLLWPPSKSSSRHFIYIFLHMIPVVKLMVWLDWALVCSQNTSILTKFKFYLMILNGHRKMNLMAEPGEQLLPTQFYQKLYLRGACSLKHVYFEHLLRSHHWTYTFSHFLILDKKLLGQSITSLNRGTNSSNIIEHPCVRSHLPLWQLSFFSTLYMTQYKIKTYETLRHNCWLWQFITKTSEQKTEKLISKLNSEIHSLFCFFKGPGSTLHQKKFNPLPKVKILKVCLLTWKTPATFKRTVIISQLFCRL